MAFTSKEKKKLNNTLAAWFFCGKENIGDLLNQYDTSQRSRTFSPWRPIMDQTGKNGRDLGVYMGIQQQTVYLWNWYGKLPTIYRFRFRVTVLIYFLIDDAWSILMFQKGIIENCGIKLDLEKVMQYAQEKGVHTVYNYGQTRRNFGGRGHFVPTIKIGCPKGIKYGFMGK